MGYSYGLHIPLRPWQCCKALHSGKMSDTTKLSHASCWMKARAFGKLWSSFLPFAVACWSIRSTGQGRSVTLQDPLLWMLCWACANELICASHYDNDTTTLHTYYIAGSSYRNQEFDLTTCFSSWLLPFSVPLNGLWPLWRTPSMQPGQTSFFYIETPAHVPDTTLAGWKWNR